MNKPAISSFKLSSYQSHPDNSNSNLNVPAVSHNYHRKISMIDTKKSSGSSELVHITSGVCMCAFLSTYTSSLCGLTMFHARKRMSNRERNSERGLIILLSRKNFDSQIRKRLKEKMSGRLDHSSCCAFRANKSN